MDMQHKVNICGVCKDISNSGKKLCMKFFRKTRLEKLHIVIEWSIKIFLFIICVIFVRDVWCNWMKEDTNFKQCETLFQNIVAKCWPVFFVDLCLENNVKRRLLGWYW